MKNFNDLVTEYKTQLEKGDVQVAYTGLVKFVVKLKATFLKKLAPKFSFRSTFQGYMDYTYFYFTTDDLKAKKLRFGLILNHEKMRFEIWLLGQNMNVQDSYWEIFKTSKWNEHRTTRPTYSILEAVLVEHPDFNDLDALSQQIETELIQVTDKIIDFLNKNRKA